MKRMMYLLAMLLVAGSVQAATYAMTVATASMRVVPEDAPFAPKLEAGAVLRAGQVVQSSKLSYMAKVDVASTPAVPDGDFVLVGKEKAIVTVQNVGASAVWLALGEDAVANQGLRLDAGAIVTLEDYTGGVSAIVGSGTASISVAILYRK